MKIVDMMMIAIVVFCLYAFGSVVISCTNFTASPKYKQEHPPVTRVVFETPAMIVVRNPATFE